MNDHRCQGKCSDRCAIDNQCGSASSRTPPAGPAIAAILALGAVAAWAVMHFA